MKIWPLIIIVAFLSGCISLRRSLQPTDPYPKNFGSEDFENLDERTGSLIAFDGQIVKKENSRNNTPAYLLSLDTDYEIWAILMYDNNLNSIGDSVRLLGYLTDIEDPKPEEDYFSGYEKVVIAMGMIDLSSSKLFFLQGADIQKNQWANGEIPDTE